MSADSTGTTYSDVDWRANLEEIRRNINDEPKMGPATSSLTAAGSSAASSLTAAGGSDRTVADQERTRTEAAPVRWPIGDESLRRGSNLKVVSLTFQLQPQTSSPPAAGLSCNLEALGPVHYLPSVAPQQLTISFLGIH